MKQLYTLAAALVLLTTGFESLHAAPSLVTIQDILYKADGTRFNGTLNIAWNNFQAGDASVVATQAVTVQVVNGVLKVQLVPTTNASAGANYQVNYSSQGKFQFTETWAVPPSTLPLRVRDVRVSTGTTVGSTTGVVTGSNLQISDISGLNNELLLRIMRGTSFSPGRAAIINAAGQIDAAAGNLSDCVRVDGSSSPCGATAGGGSGGTTTGYIDAETPSPAPNGTNPVFTLSAIPSPASSLQLYRNGLLLKQGADYILSQNTVTFMLASMPLTGDLLTASYRYTLASSITSGALTAQTTPQVLCNGTGTLASSTSQAVMATCQIPANALVAGDRVELKFGYLHLGSVAMSAAVISWGGTTLMSRRMNTSDIALYGESSILVAPDGTLQYYTSSQGPVALVPVVTAGTVLGNIQNITTLTFTGSVSTTQSADSLALKYYTVVRYPAQ